jgi:hypothetical protein
MCTYDNYSICTYIYISDVSTYIKHVEHKLTRWGRESLAEISCEISIWSGQSCSMTFPLCGRVVNVFELKSSQIINQFQTEKTSTGGVLRIFQN